MNPYFDRDLSWLSFNHRVLQEAADKTVPLYERIKFLAIYSSNLDEFFRVRVASLRSFRQLKRKTREELELKPKRQLKTIRNVVETQQAQFGRIFRREILPELEQHGICLLEEHQFSKKQRAFALAYFQDTVRPLLVLQTIDDSAAGEAPFLNNRGLYFVVAHEGTTLCTLVNIPSDALGRFVLLPGEKKKSITFLDEIIRVGLPSLLDKPISGAYAVKMSRDAELYIDDEFSGDLVEKIRESLDERHIGLPTRFLYDSLMPPGLLLQLKHFFGLHKSDLIPGARYHNFHDFFGFPAVKDHPELYDQPLPPLPHPLVGEGAVTPVVQQQDILLHFPYQRYDYVPQLIREAAADADTLSVKITLYRISNPSAVVAALLAALAAGKAVVVFIEAKARFDEASNLDAGKALEEAGAKVFYSYPGIKVHCKLLLITRQGTGRAQYLSYVGTGNFNEKTSLLYTDHALLSADGVIGRDAAQVFDVLERRTLIPQCKKLMVAPYTTKSGFLRLIDREINHARAGQDAYIILKMNSLEERDMIDKLYEASQAGVKIKLIVRGICCLVPGVPGLSHNIQAISIIDRFLEHARVFVFGNKGDELVYIASADWMNRNLHRRIEVAVPITSPELKRELRRIIDMQWRSTAKVRLINEMQDNPYRPVLAGKERLRAQVEIYRFLKKRKGDN